MTEPPTMLAKSLLALSQVPEAHVATGWTFSRHDWQQIIADRDAARGPVAFTSDPEPPTLHGLPVTVNPEMRAGFVIHLDPPCCAGNGPLASWGHHPGCFRVRDL